MITFLSYLHSMLKGLVHPKMNLLTLMLFQTSMCLFVLLNNTNEDIWKNVLIKQISFPIDFHTRKNILW